MPTFQEPGVAPPPQEAPVLSQWLASPFYRWLLRLRQSFPRMAVYQVAVSTASVGANTSAERTFSVPGLSVADVVVVNKPSHQAGLGIVNARVSAADTLAITYMNTTGGGIVPTTETYAVLATRK